MAYRFSDTLKWSDSWFVELNSMEKLLFLYLCDNCDIGGFFELSVRKIAFDLRSEAEIIKGAIKGLQRGLILSDDESCVLVRNFIKHQKNIPINPSNKAHKGIISRFNLYSNKFTGLELDLVDGYKIKGAIKGLQRGTGIGIGNDIDNGNYESSDINEDSDFFQDEYIDDEPIVLIDDFEEKKDEPILDDNLYRKQSEVIDTICIAFGFDRSVNLYANNKRIVFQFVTTQLKSIEEIDHFIQQYQNYKQYKKVSEEKEHSFSGYFGAPAMQFSNGAWNSENWGLKLQQYKSNNKNQSKFEKLQDAFNAPNPYRTNGE